MRLDRRSRHALLLCAALVVAASTAACGPTVEQPSGARLIASGPADAPAQALAPALAAPAGPVATAKDAVVLTGRASQKTRPFALAGGTYTIGWQATPAAGSALFSGQLASVDGNRSEPFANVVLSGRERVQTEVYGIKGGQYYLDISISGGDWAVAVVPQGQDALALLNNPPSVVAPSTGPVQVPPAADAAAAASRALLTSVTTAPSAPRSGPR